MDTDGHVFTIETVANYDISDSKFVANEKRLTIFIDSSLENNFGEIFLPTSLLDGDLTFYINDIEITPKVLSNNEVHFITLNFTGDGNNKLDIFGTIYLEDKVTISSDPVTTEQDTTKYFVVLILIAITIIASIMVLKKRTK